VACGREDLIAPQTINLPSPEALTSYWVVCARDKVGIQARGAAMPTGRLVRQDGRTRPHDEITADYTDMISAATPQEIVAQGLRPEVAAASSRRRRQPGGSCLAAWLDTLKCRRSRREFAPLSGRHHQRSSISQTPPPFDAGALAQHGLSRSDLLDRHRLPPLPRARR
jgi:hypothetical protein